MLLQTKAESWRRARARALSAEGLLRLSWRAALALTAALWLDEAWTLPQSIRVLVSAAGGAGFLYGVRAWIWGPWRRRDWGAVLDAAARTHPELKDHLRGAWDLKESCDGRTSDELRLAHLAQTERLLQGIEDKPAFGRRLSTPERRAAAAALLAGLTLPWVGGPAWQRVLAPWRDEPLEAYFEVSPGDAELDWGKAVEIRVVGRGPDAGARAAGGELKLWVRGPQGGWRRRAWDKAVARGFAYGVAGLTEALEYRMTWRGLGSREYRIVPVPPPQLRSLRARVHSLAGQIEQPFSAGEPLSALRGSWVVLTGRPNRPLRQARLLVSSESLPLPLTLLASGEYKASFPVRQDATFQFALEAADGRADPSPVVYRLQALADAPPAVELLSPLLPLQASPQDFLPIAFSARDDAGLSRLELVVNSEGRQSAVTIRTFPAGQKELVGDYHWPLAGLAPGAKVEFRLRASDGGRPPQSALSEKGSLEIVDFESVHRETERRWVETEKALGALAAKEEALSAAASARDAAGLNSGLEGLEQSWKDSVGALADLAAAMEKDAYSNPGVSEAARASAESLSQEQRGALPEAVSAARRGDFESARRRHEGLARELRKAQSVLKDGAGIQGLQDMHAQAGRMSRSGAEIEAALESLAAAPAGAAAREELEKLGSALSGLQKRMESLARALESMPKPAPGPEEDVRRSYELPVRQAQAAADALSRALASGDYAEAARLARELTERLAQIEKALGEAAAGTAAGRPGSSELEKARALWSEVIEAQSKSLERTQRIEARRTDEFLAGQKELIARLASEQAAVTSSAAAAGTGVVPGDALQRMKAVSGELSAGKAQRAPSELRAAASRLREEASRSGGTDGRAERFAAAEDAIRSQLESAPAAPAAGVPDAETAAAAGEQGRVREKTESLAGALESARGELATVPRSPLDRLEKAQAEQRAAEEALGLGDSTSARQRQEAALNLLDQGAQDLSQALERQKSVEAGVGEPFSRPAGAMRRGDGAGRGAKTGFVALPTAKDYRPPPALREELERSLRETRPPAFDRVVKEYFKRIAQ